MTAFVPEPGRSVLDLAGADVLEMIMAVSRDDGNGCRSWDVELLASIVPPEEREVYLAFLEATQRPPGVGGDGAALAWPVAPRRALHLHPVHRGQHTAASDTA